MKGFNADWKKSIELINQDVMRSFTNFKNGTQILQVGICGRKKKIDAYVRQCLSCQSNAQLNRILVILMRIIISQVF